MSPVLDAVLTATLARELASRLRHGRLRALRLDPSRRALALLFRHGTLRVSLDPAAAGVAWSDPIEPEPADRQMHARFRAADSLPDDRVLVLSFTRVRGSPTVVEVIVEWISNRWNAFVTEGGERVVRYVLIERGGRAAGRAWTPPTPSTRGGSDGTLTLDRWQALLLRTAPALRRRTLLAHVAWTSPISAPALLAGAAGDPDNDLRALDAGHRLWQELAATALGTAGPRPVVWSTPDGLQPYPLSLPGEAAVPSPSLIDGFTRAAASAAKPATSVPGELLGAIERRGAWARARASALRRQLAEAPQPAALRATADLLLARLGELTRGTERARLVDFAGVPVEVELDPRRSPQENASAYYERAARSERAHKRLPGLIEEAEEGARRLEQLAEAARQGAISEEALQGALPRSETARPALTPPCPTASTGARAVWRFGWAGGHDTTTISRSTTQHPPTCGCTPATWRERMSCCAGEKTPTRPRAIWRRPPSWPRFTPRRARPGVYLSTGRVGSTCGSREGRRPDTCSWNARRPCS